MAAALRSLPDDAPKDLRAYFDQQRIEENGHCAAGGGHGNFEDMARRIADFHLGVLKELGWTGLVTTMCLTGERAAMGTAVGELMVRRDDSNYVPNSVHGKKPQYFTEEFVHTTTPLLLLSAYATDAQLERALEAQERFLGMMKVPPS